MAQITKLYFRGERRPQVFPLGESDQNDSRETRQSSQIANTISANYWKGVGSNRPFIGYQEVIRQPLKFLERNQRNIAGDYSFTVDGANTGGVKQANRIRRLTPTECARLQGFPDDWHRGLSDTQAYKCYGNAVTVNVIEAIMTQWIKSLDKKT